MPNLTTNYNLKKPLKTDSADIDVLNENFDKLDDLLTPNITDLIHR